MNIDEVVLKLYDDFKELSGTEGDLYWVRFVSANVMLDRDAFIERFNVAKVDREVIALNKQRELQDLSSRIKALSPNDLTVLIQGSNVTSTINQIKGVEDGNNNSNI